MTTDQRARLVFKAAGRVDNVATGGYIEAMPSVGIKTLKNRLSEYVRAAAAGQTIHVTDRGRVVAELAPPRAPRGGPGAQQRWAELVQRGLVTPAARVRRLPPPSVPTASLDMLMKELDADREDR